MKVYYPTSKEWPINSSFGPRIDPHTGKKKSFHWGVDIACPEGTPVVAMTGGVVYRVGWQVLHDPKKGFGKRVWMQYTVNDVVYDVFYAHLSHLSIDMGQKITAGTRVGISGNTGASTGPHLHVQIRPADRSKKGIELEFI